MNDGARSLSQDAPLRRPAFGWQEVVQPWVQRLGLESIRLEDARETARPCLRVSGPLQHPGVGALKRRAQAFAALDAPAWSIDLSGVTRWDSAGLAALVYALDVSERSGKHLTFVGLPPALRRTLVEAQLHHLFTILDRDAPSTSA